jgi:hypothetical protein
MSWNPMGQKFDPERAGAAGAATRSPTTQPPHRHSRLRQAHCPNPACDWCQPCVARREAAIAAGRQDLLEPVAPVPPETACEQTREIPAVRDEIPPDQMT